MCGWMIEKAHKEKVKGHERDTEAHFWSPYYGVLWYVHKHAHKGSKSTHTLLTFQLPVHANLSISD